MHFNIHRRDIISRAKAAKAKLASESNDPQGISSVTLAEVSELITCMLVVLLNDIDMDRA